MISSGVVTIFVNNMDKAVRFYTEVLQLKLQYRAGDHWAQIATEGLTIGLHPSSKENPAGKPGSVTIGFNLNMPIESVVADLKSKGVEFQGGIKEDETLKIAHFTDPDGNPIHIVEMKKKW